MRLFVSYARVDKPLCKQVVERLSDVHDVWYDKRLHAGMDWWEEIQERLAWCEGFVYLLSPESVKSEYCQREFVIAVEQGKHLFPVLIQAGTAIPDGLSHIHYADLSNGMEDMITLMNALTIAERRHRDSGSRDPIVAPKPTHVTKPVKSAPVSTPPTSFSLLPAPFEWIEIPGGYGTMRTDDSSVTLSIPTENYWMSKYPITNAQFAKFIEEGGYKNQRWWTEAGWEAKANGWAWNSLMNKWEETGEAWTEPRYWTDSQWDGADHPVVGVSWYEAVAFCLWLSDVTGENIMLPTEDQWQYAAQGTDGREYPWGKQWDASRCNNNVDSKGIGKTTPVSQYEGKGDSPFGVEDLAGNVWEWCLTDYNNETNDVNSGAMHRVLRGGSWFDGDTDWFRCDCHNWDFPRNWDDDLGFRISRAAF